MNEHRFLLGRRLLFDHIREKRARPKSKKQPGKKRKHNEMYSRDETERERCRKQSNEHIERYFKTDLSYFDQLILMHHVLSGLIPIEILPKINFVVVCSFVRSICYL